jgi:uncharacterized protein YecE (DUF72 family)
VYHFDFDAAEALPSNIRFGTSTWTYPGWQGVVYRREYGSERRFMKESLREYAEFPWFRTVGIDSTFYAPPRLGVLEHYASLVPDSFRWVSKVWEQITAPAFPRHPRYGALSGKVNSRFLDPIQFTEEVLKRYEAPEVRARTGPFVLQFPHIASDVLDQGRFLEKLYHFLEHLPRDVRYAVEVRNREFLVPEYFAVLNAVGATHCFNHWSFMPALDQQMRAAAAAGGLSAPFLVCRILTPLGVTYGEAVKRFSPYSELKEPNEQMRRDVARFVRRAIAKSAETYVIVNNRAEGNAPMTIDALGRIIRSEALVTQGE